MPEHRDSAAGSDTISIDVLAAIGVVAIDYRFVFGLRRAPVGESSPLPNVQACGANEARVVDAVYHLEADSRDASLNVLADRRGCRDPRDRRFRFDVRIFSGGLNAVKNRVGVSRWEHQWIAG